MPGVVLRQGPLRRLIDLGDRPLELSRAQLDGGVQMTQFPLTVYRPWLRSIFLYVVPVGFVSYFPSLVVLGKSDPLSFPGVTPYLSPLVTAVFTAAVLAFWRLGSALLMSLSAGFFTQLAVQQLDDLHALVQTELDQRRAAHLADEVEAANRAFGVVRDQGKRRVGRLGPLAGEQAAQAGYP